jgi:hypothetical protein
MKFSKSEGRRIGKTTNRISIELEIKNSKLQLAIKHLSGRSSLKIYRNGSCRERVY